MIADQPAAILNVLDATNLERNLYLTLQLLEMGLPIVIALNMTDALKSQGRSINSDQLSYQLGVPVQPISALKKLGISQLLHEVEKLPISKPSQSILSMTNNLKPASPKLLTYYRIPSQIVKNASTPLSYSNKTKSF